MAKIKGIVSLKGTLGGLNYYKTKHGHIAREAGGGFNGEAIRTKASMQRVRENGSEFGHCSKINKVFRQAIGEFHEHYKFQGLHGHLMSLFTQLKDLDPISARGQRRVGLGAQTEAGKNILRQFNYTPHSQLERIFPFQPVIDATTYHIRFDHIDMGMVKLPPGATHLKLRYGVVDMDFNSMTYESYTGAPFLIDKNFVEGPLELILDNVPAIAHMCLPILGMRLYQRVGGEMMAFKNETLVGLKVLGS